MKRFLVSILVISIVGAVAIYKTTPTESETTLRKDFKPINILEMQGYFDKEEVEVEEIKEEKEWLRNIPLSEELQEYTWNLALEHELSYDLVLGVMMTESGFRPNLVSGRDYGLMQINRINHNRLKNTLGITNILNPKQNILAGVYMLNEARQQWIDEGVTSQEELFNRMLLCYNRGFTGSQKYIRKNGTSKNVYIDKVLKYKTQIEQGGI